MKKNIKNSRYEIVTELPKDAMTVPQYADQQGFSTNYLYNLYKAGHNLKKGFKIVVFNTINFVVPVEPVITNE